MKISKELFCSSIEALRKQNHEDIKNGELIREAFGAEIGLLYNNEILICAMIDLLSTEFDREELTHYCFCLNFGRIGEEVETTEQFYERLVNSK